MPCTAGDPLTHALQRLIISTSLTYVIANRLTFRIVYDVQKVRKQRQYASARRQPRPARKIKRQEKRHTPRGDHRVDVHETDGREHGDSERHCDYDGCLLLGIRSTRRRESREARSWRFRKRGEGGELLRPNSQTNYLCRGSSLVVGRVLLHRTGSHPAPSSVILRYLTPARPRRPAVAGAAALSLA